MSMIIDQQFREQIEAAMLARGISRSELARRAGVSRGFVTHVLNGRMVPGAEVMERFSAALELRPRIVLEPIAVSAVAE